MNCPSCKRRNPDQAVYCEHCGQELAAPAKRPTKGEDELWVPGGGVKRQTMVEDGPAAAPAPAPANDPFIKAIMPEQPRNPQPPAPNAKRRTMYDPGAAFDRAVAGSSPELLEAPSATAGRRIIGWIVTFDGTADGLSFTLREGRNSIGRDADRDLVLSDEKVSGKHACIQHRTGRTWVFDENSANGTFLNGEDIFDSKPAVNDGDVIRVGPSVTFLVKLIDPARHTELWAQKAAK